MPTVTSTPLNLPKIFVSHTPSHATTRKQRSQRNQRRLNPNERLKKPTTFGLYLVAKKNQHNITSFQISLSYKVLCRSPNPSLRNNSSIHCKLLPINFLINDMSARTQQLPREITTNRLRTLILPSPHIHKKVSQSANLKPNSRKHIKKSAELQLMCDNYRLAKFQSKLFKTKRFLDPKLCNQLSYNGSRLKFFYDALYQCNFPAIKFVLEREPGLLLDAVEPDTGYSILLAALLTESSLKREKLIKLLLKYLTKFLNIHNDWINESEICEKIMQLNDPIEGRDCIGWTCILGFENEFNLLIKYLLAGIDLHKSDVYGNTYLHLAVLGGSVNIVDYLCELMRKYCISIENCINLSGLNPIQLARYLNFYSILDILEKPI
ncbi:ankyrin repeat domain-containing 50-like [Schistosoma japonicum]|uniref:Ankyrin repeat domain-containing 50-like n=1 Tax=Schistosoma japonicum TaxID=6182 RepID=A0A4Z2CQE3_SCHJA|nr:ankyrin repeat domain-containing 50-like [Schistosoma japonicum]